MTPSCKWPIVSFSLNNVIWTRFGNDRNKKCFTNKQSGLSQFYTGINFFQWMEKSCLKKTLTPQIPVTTHANLVQLLTSLSLRAIQKLLHKGKRSQSTNAREKCKKMYLKQEKSNETHLSASMYIFLKTISWSWGPLQPLFPMKWSLVITPSPRSKKDNNDNNNNGERKVKKAGMTESQKNKILRWLDRVYQGQYLPSLYINYLAINKDLAKLLPQLY